MFTSKKRISYRDADPAGIVFFARYLAIAHDAYEEYLAACGISFRTMAEELDVLLPIVHTECDHRRPLWAGDVALIHAQLVERKRRKYTIAYLFYDGKGILAADCRITHVAISNKTRRAVALPPIVIAALEGRTPKTTEA